MHRNIKRLIIIRIIIKKSVPIRKMRSLMSNNSCQQSSQEMFTTRSKVKFVYSFFSAEN